MELDLDGEGVVGGDVERDERAVGFCFGPLRGKNLASNR